MRFLYTILFLVAIIAFISWLNYRLLARLFFSYRAWLIRSVSLFFTAAAILVLIFGWTRRPPFVFIEYEAYRYFVYITLAWVIGQVILLAFQPFIYVAHRLLKGKQAAGQPAAGPAAPVMTRREFLHNTLAVTPLFALGISAGGIYTAQTEMAVRRHSLTIKGLPAPLSGLKIGQISDTHLGPYFDLAKLDSVIKLMAREKPDLVVITGDFADNLSMLRPAIDLINNFQPAVPYGIYFCLGNHDYFRDIGLVRREFRHSRIVLLENSSELIGPDRQPFYLVGVDYPWADSYHAGVNVSVDKRRQSFAAAFREVPEAAFKVLIAHHPDFLIDGFKAKIPLTIAGHTHGGQIGLGGKSLLSTYTYMWGLYRENEVYGYVSSGTGHWFPLRIGCPAEISLLTLQS